MNVVKLVFVTVSSVQWPEKATPYWVHAAFGILKQLTSGLVQNHRPPTDHEPPTTYDILIKTPTPTILENKNLPPTSKNAEHRPPTTALSDHKSHRPPDRPLTKSKIDHRPPTWPPTTDHFKTDHRPSTKQKTTIAQATDHRPTPRRPTTDQTKYRPLTTDQNPRNETKNAATNNLLIFNCLSRFLKQFYIKYSSLKPWRYTKWKF